MKYTLSLTQQCNLRCSYCYIKKNHCFMTLELANRIVNEIFSFTPSDEIIDIGFFGGEPLLAFDFLKQVVNIVETHPLYDERHVLFSVTTNGTIFSLEIGEFLAKHNIVLCVSCDGPPQVHDKNRHFADGRKSSMLVESTLAMAKDVLPSVWVNAVYDTDSLSSLPQTIDYLSSFEVDRIYLNPDYSSSWTKDNIDSLSFVYDEIGDKYVDFLMADKPQYISLIDGKLSVLVKDGYGQDERCKMGHGEFAFSASGKIYPCARLIGADDSRQNCIGDIQSGLRETCKCNQSVTNVNENVECVDCDLASYCMNWCGCSNFFSTGNYNLSGPFLCVSEKAAITTALKVFKTLNHHYGEQILNKIIEVSGCSNAKVPEYANI